MQKKIIALAIASAMAVPALAYAEATVYGQARMSIDMYNDGAATTSASSNRLVSNNSRVGVKGSEDLSGGLSAVWQMEATVAMDAGTDNTVANTQATSLFNRNTFLGLKSDSMGTVLLGLYDTPYKSSTRKLDVFIDTVAADNRGLNGVAMMGTNHDARRKNSITYTSPAMSGFTVAAASQFGAEGAATTATKGSALSLAGMYEQGPIYATLAYDTLKAGSATGDLLAGGTGVPAAVDDEFKAFKLGGSYSMDAITVNAVIEKTTNTVAIGSAETTGTNLYLAGKFGISSTDAVKAAYTKRGDTTAAGTTTTNNATQFSVGYDHGMSKSTTVYALYTKVTQNLTGAADPSTLSVGMNHSF